MNTATYYFEGIDDYVLSLVELLKTEEHQPWKDMKPTKFEFSNEAQSFLGQQIPDNKKP